MPEAGKFVAKRIKMRKVSELRPHPDNPRTHSDEQVDLLCRAIRRFGFTIPILVDGDDFIIAGHGRVQAAEALDMKEVPTIDASHLSEDERKAYLIADNKLTELGGWDDTALGKLFLELDTSGIDLQITGFEPSVIHDHMKDARTGFLGSTGEGEGDQGEDAGGSSRVSEFVQLNFTLSAEDRKAVMNALKHHQQQHKLSTTGEALVSLCRGLDEGDD